MTSSRTQQLKFAAAALFVSVLVALVATRRFVLVDWSSTDTTGFLQQLFSGQIAVGALIVTGISIVIQLRSSRLGSEVLFNLVWRGWFIASTIAVTVSIGFTGALLGNWRSLSRLNAGLLPDLAVLLVVISTSALLASAMSRMRAVTSDESVARHIAQMTRRKSWRDEIQRTPEPRPIRWLAEALMGARTNGDIQLFHRLLSWWVREISEGQPYQQIRKEAASVVLSGPDTDYIVGLDRAHHQLLLGLTLGADTPREFGRQFEMLAEVAFPAFSKESEYHLRPPRPFVAGVRPVSYQTVIPGLLTLGEMTSRAITTEDFGFASTLIRGYWGPAAAAAIRLSERIIDPTNYEFADRALTDSVQYILTRYLETAPDAGKKVIREAVSVALLTTLAEAESHDVLSNFMNKFASEIRDPNLEDSFGDEIFRPWMWQTFRRVAGKEQAPVYALSLIARNAVESSGKMELALKLQWVGDEIFLFLHSVLRAINRHDIWKSLETSMVKWLWQYLERHYAQMPSKFQFASSLFDDGPFHAGFKQRYDLSCEVLTVTGQEELKTLKDAFVSRYEEAKSTDRSD